MAFLASAAPFIAAAGTMGTGVGSILTGLGQNQAANAQMQLAMMQAQIQGGYLALAEQEAQKQDTWIQNYASTLGGLNIENYKWAYDTLKDIHSGGNQPTIETALSNIKQGAASEATKAEERTLEGLATRGIAKESGLGADIAAKQSTDMTSQLNQLIANKRTEYENLLKTEAYGLMNKAQNDPTFYSQNYNSLVNMGLATRPTYNSQTGQWEWPAASGIPPGAGVPRATSGYYDNRMTSSGVNYTPNTNPWVTIGSLPQSEWINDWTSQGGYSGMLPGSNWLYNPSTGQFRNPSSSTPTSGTTRIPTQLYSFGVPYANKLGGS